MLQTWESIIQKYNSIGHTSRATKNLEEWGELLASAYIVNAEKADKLWQELIELNVATDEKFAKYFVAQIFNAIISRLDAEDAVAWKDGALILKSVSLKEALDIVVRKFDINIHLTTDKYNSAILTAKFINDESLTELMDALCKLVPGMQYQIKDNNIYIR